MSKPFDPILYGETTAKELEEYSKGSKDLSYPLPKNHFEIPYNFQQDRIGEHGDFSQVRYQLDDHQIIEDKVNGPVGGRLKQKKEEIKKRAHLLDFLVPTGTQTANSKKEWRKHPNEYTRYDTDFIDHIEVIQPLSSSISNENTINIHALDLSENTNTYFHCNTSISYSNTQNDSIKELLKGRIVKDMDTAQSITIKKDITTNNSKFNEMQIIMQNEAIQTFSKQISTPKLFYPIISDTKYKDGMNAISAQLDHFIRKKNQFQHFIRYFKRVKRIVMDKIVDRRSLKTDETKVDKREVR